MTAIVNWRKSTRSGSQAECVEVGTVQQVVAVRDTKDLEAPSLRFPSAAWEAFVRQLRS